MQSRVHLQPETRKQLRRVVERGHNLARSQGNLAVPASTNRLADWLGRVKPKARLTRGLKTETGVLNFVHRTARDIV
jgi:hypothetical protein